VTNEKQSAHGGRLRKRSRVGKVLLPTGKRDSVGARSGDLTAGADDAGALALSLMSFLQELLKRRLGGWRHIGSHELVNRPRLQGLYVRGA
jgi:hypothetical protein